MDPTKTAQEIGDSNGQDSNQVSVINLPHKWNEEERLLSSSEPEACPHCSWSGDPLQLFHGYVGRPRLSARNALSLRDCASCQLLSSILHKTAASEHRAVNDQDEIYAIGEYYYITFGEDVDFSMQTLFTTLDLRGTPFEHYKIPERTWNYNDSFFTTSAQWARGRVLDCLQSHEPCCRYERDYSFIPSRLINVDAKKLEGDVILENSSSVPPGSPYVALSYCWGGYIPKCLTTPQSVKQNMLRIPWQTLPATFQDAVNFTRSLGIKYLWIDSICIIQGDERDWSHQAGQMFHIYRNAYVTLAGLYGRSSTSGLRSTTTESQSVKLAEMCLGESRCPVYVRRYHYLTNCQMDQVRDDRFLPEWGPLLSRGWAYQERMISPRVLYFTESEIIFQCFSSVACECGASEEELTDQLIGRLTKSQLFNKVIDTGRNRDHEVSAPIQHSQGKDESACKTQQDELAKVWRNSILTNFACMDLSLLSDRLPALGAIAEQFQRARCDESYLAGLWSGSLLTDLLWRISRVQVFKKIQLKDTLNRPYSLPTWSWASLRTGIYFGRENGNITNVAEVVEARCKHAEDNPFGVLESSLLILRGRVLSCLVKWEDRSGRFTEDEHTDCSIFYSCAGGSTQPNDLQELDLSSTNHIYMDHGGMGFQCFPQHHEIYLLEMKRGPYPNDGWYLVLRREDRGKNIFSRAGVVKCNYQWRKGGTTTRFETVFEEHSVVTDCEIR